MAIYTFPHDGVSLLAQGRTPERAGRNGTTRGGSKGDPSRTLSGHCSRVFCIHRRRRCLPFALHSPCQGWWCLHDSFAEPRLHRPHQWQSSLGPDHRYRLCCALLCRRAGAFHTEHHLNIHEWRWRWGALWTHWFRRHTAFVGRWWSLASASSTGDASTSGFRRSWMCWQSWSEWIRLNNCVSSPYSSDTLKLHAAHWYRFWLSVPTPFHRVVDCKWKHRSRLHLDRLSHLTIITGLYLKLSIQVVAYGFRSWLTFYFVHHHPPFHHYRLLA